MVVGPGSLTAEEKSAAGRGATHGSMPGEWQHAQAWSLIADDTRRSPHPREATKCERASGCLVAYTNDREIREREGAHNTPTINHEYETKKSLGNNPSW